MRSLCRCAPPLTRRSEQPQQQQQRLCSCHVRLMMRRMSWSLCTQLLQMIGEEEGDLCQGECSVLGHPTARSAWQTTAAQTSQTEQRSQKLTDRALHRWVQ